MSDGKCCKGATTIVIVLLTLNTFFVGSIWCKMLRCGGGAKMCALKKDSGAKICPLTGKVLDGAKGSTIGK